MTLKNLASLYNILVFGIFIATLYLEISMNPLITYIQNCRQLHLKCSLHSIPVSFFILYPHQNHSYFSIQWEKKKCIFKKCCLLSIEDIEMTPIEDIEMTPTKTASISPYSEQRNFKNLWSIASHFRMG